MKKTNKKKPVYTGKPPKSFKFKHIIYKKEGYKSTITINREKVLNCLDLTTITELTKAFKDSARERRHFQRVPTLPNSRSIFSATRTIIINGCMSLFNCMK
jgi:hypothetical protein